MHPAGRLDRPTSRPIRRYEHPHPGDLAHLDVKKLSHIPACGTVREANWAGVEQNVDNVISLTLDTLRGEGLIERAREAPYPKLQAALAAAKGS